MLSRLKQLLQRQRSKRYFNQMIGFGLVSVVVPIMLISFFSYKITINHMEKQNVQARLDMLGQLQSRVDEQLETARKAMYSLVYDPDIARSVQMDSRTLDSQQLLDTQSKLELLNRSIDNCFEVSLYFVDSQRVLFNDRFINSPKESWVSDYPAHSLTGEWLYQEGVGFKVVTYTLALPAFSKNPRAYLSVHLQLNAFADILRGIDFVGSGNIYFLNSELHPVIGKTQSAVKESQEANIIQRIGEQDQSYGSLKTASLKVLYKKSDQTGWFTLFMIPLHAQAGFVPDIIGLTILISFLAIATGGIMIYIQSKRLYKPIYQWLKDENYAQERESGGKDEWSWLRSRWQLLKEDLQEHEPELRRSFLSALLGGYFTESKKDMPARLKQRQIPSDRPCIAFIVDAGNYLQYNRFNANDKSLVHAAMSNIFKDLLAHNHLEGDSLERPETNQTIFIVYYPKEITRDQAEQMTKQMTQALILSVETYLKFPATLGIGSLRHSVLELRNSYLEAKEALQYRIIREDEQIFDIQDVKKVKDRFEYPFDLSEKIVKELRSANRESVEESFNAFVEVIRLKNYSDQTYRQIFLMLYDAMIQGLYYFSNEAVHELLNKNGYETILHARFLTEIEEWFITEWIPACFLLIELENESKGTQIIESAKQYIAKTIDQDHSLQLVAEQVNLNPSYFSRLFRKETGQNFLQYVAELKIDEAKKQLELTNDPIYAIAEKVGYSEQTFRRVFKNQVSMSPNEYRKSLRS